MNIANKVNQIAGILKIARIASFSKNCSLAKK